MNTIVQLSVFIKPQDKRRIDLYLSHIFPYFSRSYINTLIENGNVQVNNKPLEIGKRLRLRDTIDIQFTTEKYYLDGENIPLEIIFDTPDFVIISKDPGINTHSFSGQYGKTGTLLNAILYHFGKQCNISGIERPGIIHRLDKDTSGLVIIAKTSRSMQPLQTKIAKKEIRKLYYAVVAGVLPEAEGIIESYIGHNADDHTKMTTQNPIDPKIAKTRFKLLKHLDNKYSLLEIELFTGRTHQIRVHLADMGYPIIGDKVYGNPVINIEVASNYGLTRQWLHARQLMFELFGVEYDFVAPLKTDLKIILEKNGIIIN